MTYLGNPDYFLINTNAATNNTISMANTGIAHPGNANVGATWYYQTTTTTGGSTIAYPPYLPGSGYISVPSTSGGQVATTGYVSCTFEDLRSGLRPGTEWFKPGTMIRAKSYVLLSTLSMVYPVSMGEIFMYMGTKEDLEEGWEYHYFLSSKGQITKHAGLCGSLSWRTYMKDCFEEIAKEEKDENNC